MFIYRLQKFGKVYVDRACSSRYEGDNNMASNTDDTIRARAVRYLHERFAYLRLSGNAERVDDVAAKVGEAKHVDHAEALVREMAERTTAPLAYKDGTDETLVGLDIDSVDEAMYWIQRYDSSELPPGMG